MNNSYIQKGLLTAATLIVAMAVGAQDVPVDRTKYPDYQPDNLYPDASLMVYKGKTVMKGKRRVAAARPDHWNNADTPYFPAVFSQAGGSCGSASRIGYMFSEEINAWRAADASLQENQYPTHFTWLLTNQTSGKEGMAKANGIPNRTDYGGLTYSTLFGYQTWSDNDDYGWMQGYDKWRNAMDNRIARNANFPVSVQSEEGREAWKNWLWNHNGDETFATGGVIGIGVASAVTQAVIPSTENNVANGVAGMKYVQSWGKSVDHALTVVGYDDRIEFDLNGDGVYGDEAEDEKGAWIIVNSWGNWANKGFIYCPYKYATPTGAGTTGYFSGEVYYVRKHYSPKRTFKITMEYSKRSELLLQAGISTNLNAKSPSKTIPMHHFRYAGDAINDGADAETPMLGRWADGMHYEPMEFGYDVTDLTECYDITQPLKYFFIVQTKSGASGTGKIHSCSVVDYQFDPEGLEIPFDMDADGVEITTNGGKTTISVIVPGETLGAPRNLTLSGQTATWETPEASSYDIVHYNVYKNEELYTTVSANQLSATLPTDAEAAFSVAAVYDVDGNEYVSEKSNSVRQANVDNLNQGNVLTLENSGFRVPGLFDATYPNATIEFWVKYSKLTSDINQIGPGWGSLRIYTTSSKQIIAGWSKDEQCQSDGNKLALDTWTHIAVVFEGNQVTLYKNAAKLATYNGSTGDGTYPTGFNGLGGFGDLLFGNTTNGIYGQVDEVRIWKEARTQAQIRNCRNYEIANPGNERNLLAYYRMDLTDNGLLRDCARNNHATLLDGASITTDNSVLSQYEGVKAAFTFQSSNLYPGTAVAFTNVSSPNAVKYAWNCAEAGVSNLNVANPDIVFPQAGTYNLTLTVTDANGNTADSTRTVTIKDISEPVASFNLSTETANAGDRVSFVNTSTGENCTYQWTVNGKTINGTNHSETFDEEGTYTIRLTATNAKGTSTAEKTLTVAKAAPVVDFAVEPNIIIKGDTATLIDKTKYSPTAWNWLISSSNITMGLKAQTSLIAPEMPGIYSVQLTATNEMGSDAATKTKGLTVCNADGETGLSFSGSNDSDGGTASAGVATFSDIDIFSKNCTALTIDFWLMPTSLSDPCCQIGDTTSTLALQVSSKGVMTLWVRGQEAHTADGFVIEKEWHHYAVTFKSKSATFYRDGVKVSATSNLSTTIPTLSKFQIGSKYAPMNAIIDELKVWNKTLSQAQIRSYCNQPIANVDSAMQADKLVLYCQFNQSSGNVQDATSNGYVGVRTGFGPDGDAWTTSLGIFYLNFENTATNVTSKYLKNYSAPFKYTSNYVSGTGRFHELKTGTTDSPWIIENSVYDEETATTTGFHVDQQKENHLTCTTGWNAFAKSLADHKAYQVITLPAGSYTFTVNNTREFSAASSYMVVAKGSGLPNTDDLAKEALAYSSLSSKSLTFILTEETEVSLGFVVNMSGQSCLTIQSIGLTTTEYRELTPVVPSGIAEIGTPKSSLLIEPSAFGVRLTTASAQPVSIHTLQGTVLYSGILDGTTTIPLPKGIYIINQRKVLVK